MCENTFFQVFKDNRPEVFSQNELSRNNSKVIESTIRVLQGSTNSTVENNQTSEQSHPCSSSTSTAPRPYSSLTLINSTFEESQPSLSSNIIKASTSSTEELPSLSSLNIIKSISEESQPFLSLNTFMSTSVEANQCLSPTLIESPSERSQLSSSLNVIDSTPEKLEEESKLTGVDSIDATDQKDKQETRDVRFLPVNQFRLNNDEELAMCIKQQKKSWLQLNDSKKDFQSTIGNSSSIGQLSVLKRDREENDGGKRVVKRKISDYFSPKR